MPFRCKEMADNCGKCLSLDEKFQCGWCQSSNKCEVKEKCGNDASSWLNRDQTCPNPQVTSFLPMLGPWEGKKESDDTNTISETAEFIMGNFYPTSVLRFKDYIDIFFKKK